MKKTLLHVALATVCTVAHSAPAAVNEKQPIKFGVPSLLHFSKSHHGDFKAIEKNITQATHAHVVVVQYKNMEKMAQDLADGKIGLAYIKNIPLAMAVKKNSNVTPILVAVTKNTKTGQNQVTHDDYLIVKKDSNIQTMQDLEHKTVAYWNKFSVSNYVVIKQEIEKKGIHVNWLKVSGDKEAQQAILKNKAQAFGCWDYIFASYKKNDQFRVLATYSRMDNPVIAINTNVISKEIKQPIQKQLTNVHGPFNVVGFKSIG